MALGGEGRGPLHVPIDLDALLIGDSVSRQVSYKGLRSGGDESRFGGAPLRSSPVQLAPNPNPQTIPVGGAPPAAVDTEVPASIFTPQVKVGR